MVWTILGLATFVGGMAAIFRTDQDERQERRPRTSIFDDYEIRFLAVPRHSLTSFSRHSEEPTSRSQ